MTVILLLLLALAWSWRYWGDEVQAPQLSIEDSYPVQRTVKYSFQVRNPGAEFIADAGFWAYAPVKQTAHQAVIGIRSNVGMVLEDDGLGNQRMLLEVGAIPPFGSRSVDVTVDLRLSPEGVMGIAAEGEHLTAQAYIETDDPRLIKAARQLDKGDSGKTAQAIFHWVKNRVQNRGYIEKDRGALFALTSGEGDCSEHMYLYTALSRINGIPTRGMAGFVLRESGFIKASRQHNWAESRLDGNWVVVDTDNAAYAPAATEYLAMRIIDKTSRFYGDGSQQLFGGIDKLDVTMN